MALTVPRASADREPPFRMVWRAAGLGALTFGVVNAAHLGTSGRALAALVLTATTAVAWVALLVSWWMHAGRLRLASLVLAASSGALLTAISPMGIAVAAVATLTASRRAALRVGLVLGLFTVVAGAVAVAIGGGGYAVLGWLAVGVAGGVVVGAALRQQDIQAAQTAELLLEKQRSDLEHERAEVLSERNRLAREVHDVLAHTLGALSVQMEALDSLLDGDASRDDLRASVHRTRRLVVEGLHETQRAVRVLRDEPVAVVEQVQALADHEGAALAVHGTVSQLPAQHGLALVRVAQEALTNARKHAPGAPVTIDIDFRVDSTTLTVTNPLNGQDSRLETTGGGYGLRGMRERLELIGGVLTTSSQGSQWRVHAEVPT